MEPPSRYPFTGLARPLAALISALLGTAGVFGLVLAMNARGWTPPPPPEKAATKFDVEAPKPKPPPKKKRAKKPKKRKSAKAPPPAPMLAAGLSGIDFGLPGFDAGALGDAADQLIGDANSEVMTADAVDDPPRPVATTSAPYPPKARAKGITGFVTLSLLVGFDGSVSDVKVIEAEPAGVFEAAAQQAIRGWRFEPGTYEGEPVAVRVRQTMRFDLR